MINAIRFILLIGVIIFLHSCREDDDIPIAEPPQSKSGAPTPLNLELPPHFALIIAPPIPEENPLTVEGVALGKKLFFDRRLSRDNSISCGSCHDPRNAFNDKGQAVSLGVDNTPGVRNAMPLFNLAWVAASSKRFNWHGSAPTLEEQALEPVRNHLEMKESWINVISKLQNDPEYPAMFREAFETEVIDSMLAVKAIAQFERTLISGNSRVDKFVMDSIGIEVPGDNFLTASERRGFDLFNQEQKGDCFHCHGDLTNPLWTDNSFINSGLDELPDSGLALVTKKASDVGKFKTPSLRNLTFTAPYMHDGRFNTLEEVVEFYSSGVKTNSPNLDPNQKSRNLNAQEKADIVAFLKALTDSSFVQNPAFRP